MKIIGDKKVFAFEIGEKTSSQLQTVNIYIANRNICVDDNSVYIPQFINALWHTSEFLKNKLDYYRTCLQ